jgi:hypothetical protein
LITKADERVLLDAIAGVAFSDFEMRRVVARRRVVESAAAAAAAVFS